MTLRAEIMAIGDELTTGQRLDTNSQWLAQELTACGCDVQWHTTVGDDLASHVDALRIALARADVVVSTGGLGPTADDLTRQAIAAAGAAPLRRDEACLAHIRQLFAARGRPMPERNVLQADLPQGALPIANQFGTAPGIDLDVTTPQGTRSRFFALPGVPAEMKPMWRQHVAPAVHALSPEQRVIGHYRLKCFGVGESELEAMIPALIARGREPLVGITVSDATITLRITASGRDQAACRQAMEPTIAQIRAALGGLVFGEEDDELSDAVLRLLAERRQTLATAEVATRGTLAQSLASSARRTAWFAGGEVLTGEVGGGSDSGASRPHSAEEALALAERSRRAREADYGLGIAAYPPDVDSPEARVCAALVTPSRTHAWQFASASHPAIRSQRTAKQALNALRKVLLSEA